jgi:hypothetical protein
MARLLIHVEGQTEKVFVNEVLQSYLLAQGYHSVGARIVGDPRRRQRGGICPWPSARMDIMNHLKEDHHRIETTMVDYYGMPESWPGRARSSGLQTIEKKSSMRGGSNTGRFSRENGQSLRL